jgi:hypothetical protein
VNIMEIVLHVGCAFVFGWKGGSCGPLVKAAYIVIVHKTSEWN